VTALGVVLRYRRLRHRDDLDDKLLRHGWDQKRDADVLSTLVELSMVGRVIRR
jgi:hypothetical protein